MYREKTFGVAGKAGRSGGFSSVRGFFRKAETIVMIVMIGMKEICPISSEPESSSKQEEGQTHGGHIIEKYNIPNGA